MLNMNGHSAATKEPEYVAISSLGPSSGYHGRDAVKAVVTLLWPYSASKRTISILIAEPDIRLRRKQGQVRVSFVGPISDAVQKSGISNNDQVILHLEGATYVKNTPIPGTPNRGIDWDLRFSRRLHLEIKKESQPWNILDLSFDEDVHDSSIPSTPLEHGSPPSTLGLSTPEPNGLRRARPSDSWTSPAFLKHPSSQSGLPFTASQEAFHEDDGFLAGFGRKRTKFGRRSGEWRYAAATPSPEPENTLSDKENDQSDLEKSPTKIVVEEARPDEVGSSNLIGEFAGRDSFTQTEHFGQETQPESIEMPLAEPEEEDDFAGRNLTPEASFVEHENKVPDPEVQNVVEYHQVGSNAVDEDQPVPLSPSQKGVVAEKVEEEMVDALAMGQEKIDEAPDKDASYKAVSPTNIETGPRSNILSQLSQPNSSSAVHDNPPIVIESSSPLQSFARQSLSPQYAENEEIEARAPRAYSEPISSPQSERSRLLNTSSLENTFVDWHSGAGHTSISLPPMYQTAVPIPEELDSQLGNFFDQTNSMPFAAADPIDPRLSNPQNEDNVVYPNLADQEMSWTEAVQPNSFQDSWTAMNFVENRSDYASQQDQNLRGQLNAVETRTKQIETIVIDSDSDDDNLPATGQQQTTIIREEDESESSSMEDIESEIEDSVSEREYESEGHESNEDEDVREEYISDDEHDSRREQDYTHSIHDAQDRNLDQPRDLAPQLITPDESQSMPRPLKMDVPSFSQTPLETPESQSEQLKPQKPLSANQQLPITPEATQISHQHHVGSLSSSPDTAHEQGDEDSVVEDAGLLSKEEVHQTRETDVESQESAVEEQTTVDEVEEISLVPTSSLKDQTVTLEHHPMESLSVVSEPPESPTVQTSSTRAKSTMTAKDTSATAPLTRSKDKAKVVNDSAADDAVDDMTATAIFAARSGFDTKHSHFTALAYLESHFGQKIDTVAIVTSPPKVGQSRTGPKNWFCNFSISSPSLTRTSEKKKSIPVELYRGYKSALPNVDVGKPILLRDFQVKSKNRSMFLHSTASSSYATFPAGQDEGEVNGPPVEYGDKEAEVAKGLSLWWNNLSESNLQGSQALTAENPAPPNDEIAAEKDEDPAPKDAVLAQKDADTTKAGNKQTGNAVQAAAKTPRGKGKGNKVQPRTRRAKKKDDEKGGDEQPNSRVLTRSAAAALKRG